MGLRHQPHGLGFLWYGIPFYCSAEKEAEDQTYPKATSDQFWKETG